jgi:hypothetical protein
VLESGALGQLDVFVGTELVGTPGRLERTFGSMDELVLAVGKKLALPGALS